MLQNNCARHRAHHCGCQHPPKHIFRTSKKDFLRLNELVLGMLFLALQTIHLVFLSVPNNILRFPFGLKLTPEHQVVLNNHTHTFRSRKNHFPLTRVLAELVLHTRHTTGSHTWQALQIQLQTRRCSVTRLLALQCFAESHAQSKRGRSETSSYIGTIASEKMSKEIAIHSSGVPGRERRTRALLLIR